MQTISAERLAGFYKPFMSQLETEDERVMRMCEERMQDQESMTSAVARLTYTDEFNNLVARVAIARRTCMKMELEKVLIELAWVVEDEIIKQARREVVGSRS